MKDCILHGNCIETLKTIPDASVDCCITSPPYYGLRDYGTGNWIGGDPNCDHMYFHGSADGVGTHKAFVDTKQTTGTSHLMRSVCKKCGAIRQDSQIGLEETPDEYIDRLVSVFREVKRILKPEGTLWVNIGDSYAAQRGGTHQSAETLAGGIHGVTASGDTVNRGRPNGYNPSRNAKAIGLKHKDLIGIPWMLAFALRNDGWYLRQDIIWHKPNPMPESVKDRCTKSHEYIFLLSKTPKYYFDYEAIQETATTGESVRDKNAEGYQADYPNGERFSSGLHIYGEGGKRNKRKVILQTDLQDTRLRFKETYRYLRAVRLHLSLLVSLLTG